MAVKILWFSRHDFSEEQYKALLNKFPEEIKFDKFNGLLPNVHIPWTGEKNNSKKEETFKPFKELIQEYDVIAIVAPIGLQQQILSVAGEKPVITAIQKSIPGMRPEDKPVFVFDGWKRLIEVKVVMEDFA